MPEPRIYQSIQRFKNALSKSELQSAKRLVNAYGGIYQRLQDKIRALEADIADLEDGATPGKVAQMTRYKTLLRETANEMDRYSIILENEIATLRGMAIEDGVTNARQLVQQALPPLPNDARNAVMATFNRLPKEAVNQLLGALSQDSPLNDLLQSFGDKAALSIGQTILEGVGLGYNPVKVAAKIKTDLGGNLSRALTIARTEMLRSYRTASLANYAANPDIVKGWEWQSTKDEKACLACIALDGKSHGVNETFMKAHPNCRCAPKPVTVTYKELGLNIDEPPNNYQTAGDWFEKLPDATQRGMMSAKAFDAYKSGKVTLRDFIDVQKSKDWGDAYVEKPISKILDATH